MKVTREAATAFLEAMAKRDRDGNTPEQKRFLDECDAIYRRHLPALREIDDETRRERDEFRKMFEKERASRIEMRKELGRTRVERDALKAELLSVFGALTPDEAEAVRLRGQKVLG